MDTSSLLWIMLPAFCECLVLVGIHSYLGIHVIKRKVIFVDLAFAQIAALGTLVAFLFGIPPHTAGSFVFALILTGVGAAVFSLCRFRRSKVPQEAVIGLVYAIAAATAILLIDKAPHGAEHLKEILTGSILWVRWSSILTAAVVYAGVGFFHYVFRRRFLLISEDPEAAWKAGINVRLWDFLFYLSFGLVITLSVDVAGVLIVFVFLVAPAILAMLVSDRLAVHLAVGWGLGVVVTAVGLIVAYVKDLSTGPAVIATYAVVMILVAAGVYVLRAERRGVALRNATLVPLAFAAATGVLFLVGGRLGEAYRSHDVHEDCAHAKGPSDAVLEAVRGGEPIEEVLAIFRRLEDPGERADKAISALGIRPAAGATLALEFLDGGPPPFFRQQVLDRLEEAMGKDPGFVADAGPEAPANPAAVDRVRAHFGLEYRPDPVGVTPRRRGGREERPGEARAQLRSPAGCRRGASALLPGADLSLPLPTPARPAASPRPS